MKKMSCPCNIHPSIHPSIHGDAFMHAASLLAYLEIMKTINYVIELAKEQQAIVLGEVCASPNCSQIATDPSQWPLWDMLYNAKAKRLSWFCCMCFNLLY
jgi:hypothetical protein